MNGFSRLQQAEEGSRAQGRAAHHHVERVERRDVRAAPKAPDARRGLRPQADRVRRAARSTSSALRPARSAPTVRRAPGRLAIVIDDGSSSKTRSTARRAVRGAALRLRATSSACRAAAAAPSAGQARTRNVDAVDGEIALDGRFLGGAVRPAARRRRRWRSRPRQRAQPRRASLPPRAAIARRATRPSSAPRDRYRAVDARRAPPPLAPVQPRDVGRRRRDRAAARRDRAARTTRESRSSKERSRARQRDRASHAERREAREPSSEIDAAQARDRRARAKAASAAAKGRRRLEPRVPRSARGAQQEGQGDPRLREQMSRKDKELLDARDSALVLEREKADQEDRIGASKQGSRRNEWRTAERERDEREHAAKRADDFKTRGEKAQQELERSKADLAERAQVASRKTEHQRGRARLVSDRKPRSRQPRSRRKDAAPRRRSVPRSPNTR